MQKLIIVTVTCVVAGSLLLPLASGGVDGGPITVEQLQSGCKYCKCLDKPTEDYYDAIQGSLWLRLGRKLFTPELQWMVKLYKRIANGENKENSWIGLATMDNQMEFRIHIFEDWDTIDFYVTDKLRQAKSIWDDEDCRSFFLYELHNKVNEFE